MNVFKQMYNVIDFFKMLWSFLDSIILIPDTEISFADVVVVISVLGVITIFLFRSFGGSLASGVVSSVFRSDSKGGAKSDT